MPRDLHSFPTRRSSDLQCYNVLPQLDINNTIDHRPEGDEKWFLENEKTVTQFCRKLAAERPLKDIRDEYNYPKKKGIKRSEERRVGKECKCRWWQEHEKKIEEKCTKDE